MKNKIKQAGSSRREKLTPEEYKIIRKKGTEAPFSGKYVDLDEKGLYRCRACGQKLFSSKTKYHSGTGWPSFYDQLAPDRIILKENKGYGMNRPEAVCSRCGAHLGHVFADGPKPTGERYCINSLSLQFEPDKNALTPDKEAAKAAKATFAAGCFWGVEEKFRKTKGILSTRVGYTGGHTTNPTYEEICGNKTGHQEAVEINYNPAVISYNQLIDIFWSLHDPTDGGGQGPDRGSQYLSAIFYHNEGQRQAAARAKEKLEKSGKYNKPIATAIRPVGKFYPAEEYHQKYLKKRNQASCRR